VVAPYFAQYVRGNSSIDRVYGIRRETDGTIAIGDSRVSVEMAGDVTVWSDMRRHRGIVVAPDQHGRGPIVLHER
jgi:hypothetical protein